MKVLALIVFISPIWGRPNGTRIIGGQPAHAAQFPYAAAIYKRTVDGTYFCTGCILNTEWVLTAGQCVEGATLFTILLGTHILSGDEETVVRLATEHYFLHPEYNPITLEHDIGLIQFRSPVTFTTYIRNLYLPFVGIHDTSTGIAYGWGQISDADATLSDTLQHTTLNAVSDAECRLTYGGQLVSSMACFEGPYNEGTCFGDAGSPLIQDVSRGYTVVIAIATFFSGNGCESTDPSGYTRVFAYNDWIRNITNGAA